MATDTESDVAADQASDASKGLHQLWKHYLPLARKDVLFASLMINLLSLALPMLTLQIYDRIIPNQAMETMVVLTMGMIVAVILDVFLKTARAWLAAWTGARYEHHAGCKAMDRMLASNLEDMEDVVFFKWGEMQTDLFRFLYGFVLPLISGD